MAVEPPDSEWICGAHWRAVPRVTRQSHLRLKRACRRDPGLQLVCRIEAIRAWEACRSAAIQGACGL